MKLKLKLKDELKKKTFLSGHAKGDGGIDPPSNLCATIPFPSAVLDDA